LASLSLGLMLLHRDNQHGKRAEVVTVERAHQ
jgi:hypothetical protein